MAAIASLLNPAPSSCPSPIVSTISSAPVEHHDGSSVHTPSPVQLLPACPSPAACPSLEISPSPNVGGSVPGPLLWTLDHPTHAERSNPAHIQPTKRNGVLSEAQKASRKLQRVANLSLQEKLCEDLESLLGRHQEELEALAARHGKKMEYLDKLRGTSRHYKLKRGAGLENAKLHAKSMEINSDRLPGSRAKLSELRQLIKNDPTYQNLSKEEEEELRKELEAFRVQKKTGARPSNRSAGQDYRSTVDTLNDEITALSSRTGCSVICFFSRSHIEDTFEPNFITTTNASEFAQASLGLTMWEVTRLFEQWACSKAKVRNLETLSSLQHECSSAILQGLRTVSQANKAQMNYKNYDMQIVQKHGVKLVGWTHSKLTSPSEISTVDDVRSLRDALRCGACHWIRLTKSEVTKHAKELETRETAGEVVGTKRKERSDKGVERGPRKRRAVAEGTPAQSRASSKQKAAKSKGKARSQLPPSKATVSDSDHFNSDSDDN